MSKNKKVNVQCKLPKSIVIIGSGNLASHLIEQFTSYKLPLVQVISRSSKKSLKKQYKKKFQVDSNLSAINQDANLYIIAISDDAISDVVENWPFKLSSEQIVVHTSGSVSSKVLKPLTKRNGVLWPIQSVIKSKKTNWKKTPICITGNTNKTINTLLVISQTISKYQVIVKDQDRKKLHLMAVVLNNFSNHLYCISNKYLEYNNLPFEIFLPILKETVSRLSNNNPCQLQTGPAQRGDAETMLDHIKLLQKHKDFSALYKLMSKSITVS